MKYHCTQLNYSEIKMLAPVTRAYLNNDPTVTCCASVPFTKSGVHQVISQRAQSDTVNRTVLVSAIQQQYGSLLQEGSLTEKHVSNLLQSNCYSITTGHQLNLFTGPAYFFYKIISVIEACKELNGRDDYSYVPIYWMATEDHDFEEINHTYFKEQKVIFESDEGGMVGEIATDGMAKVIDQVAEIIGDSFHAKEVLQLFQEAYLNHENLADATRYLVHTVFGKYGLIVVDGNDPLLKKCFIPIMEKELLEQTTFARVSKTNQTLLKGYDAQVNPREINLFYTRKGWRKRIVQQGNVFSVLDTDIQFTPLEIQEELRQYPERFSPNALLRPVYQECILPNVMYFGGGAEVAYWLELKSTFEAFGVSYPVIAIRNAFLMLDKGTQKRMDRLGLTAADLFLNKDVLVKKVLAKSFKVKQQLDQKLAALFNELDALDLNKEIPLNLQHSADIAQHKIRKAVGQLEKKAFTAHKRESAIPVAQLEDILHMVFVGGTFQERKLNGFDLMLQYGDQWVSNMMESANPFCGTLTVVHV